MVDFPERETGHEWSKTFLNFFLRRRAHAAVGAAMKRIFRADDFVALAFHAAGFFHAVQPREFDQGLVRFGAAVAEKHPARAGVADDSARELTLQRITKEIADVNQLRGLPLHRA